MGITTDTPEVDLIQSSRTRLRAYQFNSISCVCVCSDVTTLYASAWERTTTKADSVYPTVDRNRTVSRRSKPNSRTTLIGEQPNP